VLRRHRHQAGIAAFAALGLAGLLYQFSRTSRGSIQQANRALDLTGRGIENLEHAASRTAGSVSP
jgi:cbb3-type cytochrome oxidase subunit 3